MKKSIFTQPLNLDVLTQISKMFPEAANVESITFQQNINFPTVPYGTFNAKLTSHPMFLAEFLKSLHRNCFIARENLHTPIIIVDYTSLKGRKSYYICIIHLDEGTKSIGFEDISYEGSETSDSYRFKKNLENAENIIFAIPYIDGDPGNIIEVTVTREEQYGRVVVNYKRGNQATRARVREMLEG